MWQTAEQVDSSLDMCKSESKKREAIKIQLRFRKIVLQQEADDALFKFSAKGQGQFNSQILRSNLMKLIKSAGEIELSVSSLTGKTIDHRFKENDGKFNSYRGKIISQVPGFPEWFNVVYNNEPDVVYSYNLTEDMRSKSAINTLCTIICVKYVNVFCYCGYYLPYAQNDISGKRVSHYACIGQGDKVKTQEPAGVTPLSYTV